MSSFFQSSASQPDAAKGIMTTQYARSKRALMATINQIRSTGAAVDIDLPTIVVAGNQSSGKSSLIEALSGINLPRAVGTCTRVPIEVRLRQDDGPWSCRVKVRRGESSGTQTKNTKAEVPFGEPITDPSAVEAVIRRAQLGILNPSVELDRFVTYKLPKIEVPKPLGSERQFAFSANVIVLEITGPDVTDLTLVDLPGIIQCVRDGEDSTSIDLIAKMVRDYVSRDCLILLVITMRDDISNQRAVTLAKEADPKGERTIGVLTKADTISGSAETDFWLKVVKGQTDKLNHGYYVTRQPGADALASGISFVKAREQEERFFSETEPWSGLGGADKMRLGTKNLSAFLSDQLTAFIKMRLPDLESQIDNRQREIEGELGLLGEEPTGNPALILFDLLTDFEKALDKHIDGSPDNEAFIQTLRSLAESFVQIIEDTKPQFVFERASANQHSAKRMRTSLDHIMRDPKARMDLDDMRLLVESCRTHELPNEIPPSALRKVVSRSTKTWEGISLGLLESVKPIVRNLLETVINDCFGKFAHGPLPLSVDAIVTQHLARLFDDTRDQIRRDVAKETNHPYTLNTDYLKYNQAESIKSLRRQREPETSPHTPTTERGRGYSWPGRPTVSSGTKEAETAKPQPDLEYELETLLMAQISAYWEVAQKRVIDNVPLTINSQLITQLCKGIRSSLTDGLHVCAPDAQARCKEYLAEAPEVVEQRAYLTSRKARLEEAKATLRKSRLQKLGSVA